MRKRGTKLTVVLRKKIFPDVYKKIKMRKKLGATRPNVVLGVENRKWTNN